MARLPWHIGTGIRPRAPWQHTLVVAVVLLGALLRVDALVAKWGLLDGPPWARGMQQALASAGHALRPATFAWLPEPYLWGDPYDDLENARQMRSFYRGSYREPVFVFATRFFQDLVGDQQQVICLASALFSILSVWATYLVGAYAFSWWVGVGAALGLAVERDVIGAGVIGSRDDAFVFFLLLFVYALLKVREEPTWRRGAWLGLAGSLACLTRITALSFVVPGLAYLAFVPGRDSFWPRWRAAAASALVTAIVVGPFFVFCWITYGDPLYSINTLTSWYTLRAQSVDGPTTPLAYLSSAVTSAPFTYLETVLAGLTDYQHRYKWIGFDRWLAGLGDALRVLSIPGVFLMLWSGRGRAVLFAVACSTIPFIFTWTTPGLGRMHHFRFTQATYPFLLMAAALTVVTAVVLARAIVQHRWARGLLSREMALKTAATAGGLMLVGLTLMVVPVLRMRQDLSAGGGIVVMAGGRDRVFFRSGWYPPLTSESGNVTARFSRGRIGRVFVPMQPHRAHRLTLRLDPFVFENAPPQHAAVSVNGKLLGVFALAWDPNRVGEYVVTVPADAVDRRFGEVEVTVTYSTRPEVAISNHSMPAGLSARVPPTQDVGFLLWAVVVEPLGA